MTKEEAEKLRNREKRSLGYFYSLAFKPFVCPTKRQSARESMRFRLMTSSLSSRSFVLHKLFPARRSSLSSAPLFSLSFGICVFCRLLCTSFNVVKQTKHPPHMVSFCPHQTQEHREKERERKRERQIKNRQHERTNEEKHKKARRKTRNVFFSPLRLVSFLSLSL